MTSLWFDEGDTVELTLIEDDGKWHLDHSDVAGDTRCLFDSEFTPDDDHITVKADVVNFRRGQGNSTNYLKLSDITSNGTPATNDDVGAEEHDAPPTSTDSTDGAAGKSDTQNGTPSTTDNSGAEAGASDTRDGAQSLLQLDGGGDYVTVEATIADVVFVKKGAPDTPDFKGVLTERGSTKRIPFVVEDGAGHPYFEEGARFRFEGAKDHLYETENEVQLLVTEHTNIEQL